jgi:ferrous iron transport protein A
MSFLDCHDLVSRFNPDFTADENFMEFVYQNIPKDKEVIKGDGYVDVIPSDSPTIRVIPTFKDINPNELDIKVGQSCKVKKLNSNGKLLSKLLDMGFVNGADIKMLREAPLMDPIEIRIQNYNISIRRSEASLIEVEQV